jgi:creatinine amidohydrolase
MTNIFEVSHSKARGLLAGGAPVFLPINPVEYHGPHLSLHNDALISRGLAHGVHAELAAGSGAGEKGNDWPFLVASDLEIGVDPTPGLGSRATSYREACAVVVGACRALVELGAKRVVLVTFHGSPLHSLAVDAGVRWLGRHGVPALSPLNLLLRAMLDIRVEDYADAYATVEDATEREAIMREAPFDLHAGFLETSLALNYAPDSVDPLHTRLPPCPEIVPDAKLLAASRAAERFGRGVLAKELRFSAFGLGWHALRPFPGYTSRPHRASREAGAVIARHIVREFAATSARVLAGEEAPPTPIMPWIAPLTLGGTFSPDAIPIADVARFEMKELSS